MSILGKYNIGLNEWPWPLTMTLTLQKNGLLIFWWKEPERHVCQHIRLIRRSSTHFLICDIHWCFSVEVAAYTTKDLLGLISFQPFRRAEIKWQLRLIQITRQVTDGQLPSGSTFNITCNSQFHNFNHFSHHFFFIPGPVHSYIIKLSRYVFAILLSIIINFLYSKLT